MIVIESGERIITRLNSSLDSGDEELIMDEIEKVIRYGGLRHEASQIQNLIELVQLDIFAILFTIIKMDISRSLDSTCLRVMSKTMYHISRLTLSPSPEVWRFIFDDEFVPIVKSFATNDNIEIRLDSWYFLQQIAGSHPPAHTVLHNFIEDAQRTIVNQFLSDSLRGRAVRFCSHLACHPENREALLKFNLPESLKLVMNSGNIMIGSTSATVAVSVLIGEEFEINQENIQTDILTAFACSLKSLPYPPASRIYPSSWRYGLAILTLSKNFQNRAWMIDNNILELIKICLEQCQDPRTRASILNTLWNLST